EEVIAELIRRRPRAEERGRRVDDDRLDLLLFDRRLEPVNQAVDVVLAADDGGALHRPGEVEHLELAVLAQAGGVEAEEIGGDDEVVASFLDADEQRRQPFARYVSRDLKPEDGLARPAATGDERRAPLGKAAVREDVKPGDAGRELCDAHALVPVRRIRAARRAALDV